MAPCDDLGTTFWDKHSNIPLEGSIIYKSKAIDRGMFQPPKSNFPTITHIIKKDEEIGTEKSKF